jgi:MAF protein
VQLLGWPFEATVPRVHERRLADETPAQLVERLSRAKAEDADLNGYHDVLVLACDTVVALRDRSSPNRMRVLGKPSDREEARVMLDRLWGRRHLVYSGVTILDPSGRTAYELAATEIMMRAYDACEVAVYVASGDPLDKAGAYAIQHEGFHPVQRIEGCYAGVMGLPLCHAVRCLRRLGYSPTTEISTACQAYTGRRCDVYQEILAP